MSLIICDKDLNIYKLNKYSIIKSDGSNAKVIVNDKEEQLTPAFMHDGVDLYVFPFETSVIIDGETYTLSLLSYIDVGYKDQVEIYDNLKDEYKMLDTHNNDIIATLDNVKINLDTDMINDFGETRLLIKKVDKLPLYIK